MSSRPLAVRRRRREHELREALGVVAPRLRWLDLVREAGVSVARHPGRSLLTALGTVLAAAAFVATLGVGSTLERQVSSSFDVRRATEVRVVAAERDVPTTWQEDVALKRLRALNGVTAAGRRILLGEQPVSRTLAAKPHGVKVIGADPGALAVMAPHFIVGRGYDAFHESRAAPVVLLPVPIADELGIGRVGVAVVISDRIFTVMGIFTDVARRPEALLAVVMPASAAESLVRSGGQIDRDVVAATSPGAAQLIGRQAPLALRPEQPMSLRSTAPPDPRTLRREIESNVTRFSLLLATVALVIGTVSIANAATGAIVARIPEIGLRRAVGARPAHVFAQLLSETTALGTVGGLVGVCVGAGIVALVALVNRWVPVLDVRVAGLAVAACTCAGLLAGLWPAARATRIQPVAALQR